MPSRRAPVSRRERPAKPALSRAGVVAAAVAVMRSEGLEKVTMRRLAAELDTGPASLYVYVANLAELHGAVLDELLGEIGLEPGEGDWQERLIALLTEVTVLLHRHPALARSVLTLRPRGPRFLRLLDTVLALLQRGGVEPAAAAWGVDLLLQHTIATAAEQGTRDADKDADSYDGLLDDLAPEEFPHLAGAGALLFSGTGPERLAWSFRALVAGIEAVRPGGTAAVRPGGTAAVRPGGTAAVRPAGRAAVRPAGRAATQPTRPLA